MKKFLILLIIPFLSFGQELTYVPDDVFEQKLIDLGYDDVLDNYVLTENINQIDSLDLVNSSISDLTGIEDFSSLVWLNCANMNLTELDVSQNVLLETLYAGHNYLSEIDVTQNLNLKNLSLMNITLTMNISSIDVSQNSLLESLYLEQLPITELDVSQNNLLKSLHLQYVQITELDVSQNLLLETLHLYDTRLCELDVSNSPNLYFLNCAQPTSPALLCCITVADAVYAWQQEQNDYFVKHPNAIWVEWDCEGDESFIENCSTFSSDFGICNGGCIDSSACNYNPEAENDDGSCDYSCIGCMDFLACNFNPIATEDDDSCLYVIDIYGVDYLNCFGFCINDTDFDGICDEIDDCIGTTEECNSLSPNDITWIDPDWADFDWDTYWDDLDLGGIVDWDNIPWDLIISSDMQPEDLIYYIISQGITANGLPFIWDEFIDFSNNSNLNEYINIRTLIKVVDVLGREIDKENKDALLLYIYNDGSVEKKYIEK